MDYESGRSIVLFRLAVALPAWLRAQVAKFRWLPFDVLTVYLGETDSRVRFNVLEYHEFTESQLDILCSSYIGVQRTLAFSERIGVERVERFLLSEVGEVRQIAAMNVLLTGERLRKIAADTSDFHVKDGILHNLNTPLDVLVKLSKDENKTIGEIAALALEHMEEDTFVSKLQEIGAEEFAQYPRAWVMKALG